MADKKTKGTASAATNRMIAAIRRPFAAFRDAFGKLAVTRAELAPKLIRAFEAYRKDTAGSFVSFVALLDPTVPVADREEYRNHPAYQAANYLKRLGGRTDTAGKAAKPMRSNLANMGRVIAVLTGLVNDQEKLWKGIETEFGLTARQVGTLKKVVAASKPLADIKIARPQPVKINHVDPAEAAETVRTVTRAAA